MGSNESQYLPMELTKAFDIIGFVSAFIGNGKPTAKHYRWSSPFIPYNDNTTMQLKLDLEDDNFTSHFFHLSDVTTVDLAFFPKDQKKIKEALSNIEFSSYLQDPSIEYAMLVSHVLHSKKQKNIQNFGYAHFKDGEHSLSAFPEYSKQSKIREILRDILGVEVDPAEFTYDLLSKSHYRVSEYSRAEKISDEEKRKFAIHREIAKKRLLKVMQ